jgi:antirestriction protein
MKQQGSDAEIINTALAEASQEGRPIDEFIARKIASLLHTGQNSAYYALASSGHVDADRLRVAMEYDLKNDVLDEQAKRWVGALALHLGLEAEMPAIPEAAEVAHPRIYVADLAAYTNGHLHGEWMDATQDVDELWEQVEAMLSRSPVQDAEEIAIHDFEGFRGVTVHEYAKLDDVVELARAIEEHGEPFAVWLNRNCSDNLRDALETFEDAYIGQFRNEDELGEHLIEMLGVEEVMTFICNNYPALALWINFDTEAYMRDLDYGGEIMTHENGDGTIYAFLTA